MGIRYRETVLKPESTFGELAMKSTTVVLLTSAAACFTGLCVAADQRSAEQDKARQLKRAMSEAKSVEQKLEILDSFGKLSNLEGLKRVEWCMYQNDVSEAACAVVVQLAKRLADQHPNDAAIALKQVLRRAKSDDVKNDACEVLAGLGIDAQAYLQEDHAKVDSGLRKIAFVAGPVDHAGPGAHEYVKDLILLKKCLDESPDLQGITTELLCGRMPPLEKLDDAATIVVHSSGDRLAHETHALFPSSADGGPQEFTRQEAEYAAGLDALMKRGVGMVILHYSLWTDNPRSRRLMLDWIGGYHEAGRSRVKMDTVLVEAANSAHPILRGMRPWKLTEEYYYNQRLRQDHAGFTPILKTMIPSNAPEPHVIAWAIQREAGRGFGFSGCHTHEHLWNADYRRLVFNAIVWTASLDVPRQGVVSTLPKNWQ